MKRSRFSEEQIIGILKEHDAGIPVAELCRRHGVSDASIYKWKAEYGGMEVSETKRLGGLEGENAKLKRMLADAMLDNVALKDLLGNCSSVSLSRWLDFGDCRIKRCACQHASPARSRAAYCDLGSMSAPDNPAAAALPRKTALITGITGQDGAYLADFLIGKGYVVHGIRRRASSFNSGRIEHLYQDPHDRHLRFLTHYGDLTDSTNLIRIIQKVQPDEIYNLGAQSHVRVSFETPEYTANADGVGTLRLVEALRILGMEKTTRFYQASTSELYGLVREIPQRETTSFYPRSPYAAAKLYAYWITVNYREAYGMHASNGILFNHESPIRGETFVTRKISRAVAAIELGLQERLYLGNLEAKRDWGHARDFVEGMWAIVQQDEADDYVLATGEAHAVREFVEKAFAEVGRTILWRGTGIDERGHDGKTNKVLVEIDPRYFRPTEADFLVGDASKAHQKLKWRPRTTFDALVKEMVAADLVAVKRDYEIRKGSEQR